jgi:tetratricopeptide (TPR) repeat protein
MSGLESSREFYIPHIQAALQPAPAQKPVQQSNEAPTKDVSHLLKNAILLARNNEHQLAMNLLRTALAHKPNDRVALKWLGYCFKETGKLQEAIRCFTAFDEQIADSDVLFFVSECYYLLEKDKVASQGYIELLSRVDIAEERRFEAYKNLGNINVRVGDFDAAEECYDKAYTLKPSSDVLMVNYGTLEIQRENLEAAIERFRQAVQLNANNDKAWVGLAMVHRHMGDLELSQANIERALDINQKNRTALNLIIEWEASADRFNSSITRLQQYLSIESEDAEMAFTLAKIFAHTNRIDDANLEMARVLALNPAIEGGLKLMAILHNEKTRRILTR